MNANTPARAAGRNLVSDVVVIGGGLAGLCAATAAAKAGARVTVVRRGLGATAMSSGGLDFPAVLPGLYGPARDAAPDSDGAGCASAGFAGGVLAGGGANPAVALTAPEGLDPAGAAAALAEWFAAAGSPLEGKPGAELPLLDIAGHVRRTNLALSLSAAGRVDRWAGRRVLFLGVEGYAPYRPEWTLRMAAAQGLIGADQAEAGYVPVPGLEGEANLPAARIARALETPDNAAVFAAAVAGAAARNKADLVALPPVLGLRQAHLVARALSDALAQGVPGRGVVVFELLSPPPSVPGQRLQTILDHVAEAAGVTIVPGRVTRAVAAADDGHGRSLLSVTVDVRGRSLTLNAAQFVLAAGKFAAGGLAAKQQVLAESVFGLLPVFAPPPPGDPPGQIPPAGRRRVRDLVWQRFAARHPVFEAGLAVDAALRPIGPGGEPAYANLRAAGSIIGGYSPFADGAGAGVAVTTGLQAGRAAAGSEGGRPA